MRRMRLVWLVLVAFALAWRPVRVVAAARPGGGETFGGGSRSSESSSSSNNLFEMLAYWIEAYKKERLRNVTEGARIEQLELARVASDKFFDTLTVRLFATSLDFTIADDDGRVVGGSRNKPRRYTEYWTLIRASGKTGTARPTARVHLAVHLCKSKWQATAPTAARKSPLANSTGSSPESNKTTSTKANRTSTRAALGDSRRLAG